MRLLLDTHTFLWHAKGDQRMSATATAVLTDPTNELFLSMATVWELAIKVGLKKLALASPFATFITEAPARYALTVLPITTDDCVFYESLPFPNPHHRDPFDRLLVTHVVRNGLALVGVDAAVDPYGITHLW